MGSMYDLETDPERDSVTESCFRVQRRVTRLGVPLYSPEVVLDGQMRPPDAVRDSLRRFTSCQTVTQSDSRYPPSAKPRPAQSRQCSPIQDSPTLKETCAGKGLGVRWGPMLQCVLHR